MVNYNKLDSSDFDITFPPLSKIEIEILRQIKKGLTSSEIAVLRDCSPRTVEKHRSNIIKKLDIPSTQNALLVWIMKNPNFLDT